MLSVLTPHTHYTLHTGFDRSPHLSDLDFALEIASDRGRMSLVGGKRGNTLTPEDLADLNRYGVHIFFVPMLCVCTYVCMMYNMMFGKTFVLHVLLV